MTVLALLFLILTGVDAVSGDATAATPVTVTETTNDPADDTTPTEGGDSVRKSPIG